MKKVYLLMLAFAMVTGTVQAKDDEGQNMYDYELSLSIEHQATTSGFKVFKVWSFGRKKEAVTQEINMRNAVHGILFKGLVAGDMGKQGNVPPLVPDGYESHREYFDAFFSSGEYKQFVQATSRGLVYAGDVIKINSKRYKVGMLVQVNVNGLRKRLEKDGIITSVGNIFRR